MDIKHELKGTKGAFFVEENGSRLAEMTYTKAGEERMIIDHTEVSDALRGKSVGKQLVTAAVEMARQQHFKILPLCPFAHALFQRVPEFADVWDR
jgi:predicted GNAT family acetyltransferase